MPLKRPRRGGLPLNRHTLHLWLRSPRGKRLLALEEREVGHVLPEVFGRHVLQIGCWGREGQLVARAETVHKAVLGTFADTGTAALIDPEQLPLPEKSVDAVLLPHTLEFAHSAHNVLREATRVLNDRGRLLILGFNPWSGWALRNRLGLRYRAFPAGGHFHGVGRLCDWLELLDLEVTQVRRFGVGFPWFAPYTVGEPWHLGSWLKPFAESYLLVAKKRVIPINLVGRLERAQIKPLVGVPVVPGVRSQVTFDKTPPP
jgi:SAM-dependent methyltransferase